jgi:two-component system OmpR family response regulator
MDHHDSTSMHRALRSATPDAPASRPESNNGPNKRARCTSASVHGQEKQLRPTDAGAMLDRAVRVLVVEDEVKLASLIRKALKEEGLLADVAIKGEDALWMAAASPYDVVILDINLPGIDGFETSHRLRAEGVRTPILMLTARDGVDDRIRGLDTGADDYVVKPFDFDELLARIRALSRRGPIERGTVLEVGDLTLDTRTHELRRGGVEIPLSVKELQVLEVFMRRPGQVLSRYDLLEGAWEVDYENRSNVVDVYVRYLREKIDRPFGVESIDTVRGAGYRMRAVRQD